MIDELIKKKFSGTVVAGIVISGSECRTYKMDIPASGIYRLVELQRFDLITRKTQIAVLPQVVEGFLQIKGIIAPTVTAIEARMNSRNTQSANNIPSDWHRASLKSPKEVKKRKRCNSDE
ncbi:hypothetical protein VTP01DRAFT_8893 [Rhizomucor pusillus]|uniref:uncharacterized protein n=1 Tax=Rhizomucor pusillus TaxID=4840 RepID=UPI00374317BE